MASNAQNNRVVSGIRPTGGLHLGNYHGALKNWASLQHEYECFFFVADWHALTTNYENTEDLEPMVWQIVVDLLAGGLNPGMCTMFIQSHVPEHAELHLLLSMMTPLSWLERVPTYKDQQEKLKEKDLATYGFLGYPLLQSADILLYRPAYVPVGADQVAHVEIAREVARRFNHLYGREPGFEDKAAEAIRKMGGKNAKLYKRLMRDYQEKGDADSLEKGRTIVNDHASLTVADKERLLGFIEGGGRSILVEPEALLTPTPKVPGVDGQKMSKSYNNTIGIREEPDSVDRKLRTMQTDPARVRRNDPGDPEKCPVWELHKIYSDEDTRQWVCQGCTTAGIGCLDCKKRLIDRVVPEITEMRDRGKEYEQNPDFVRNVIAEGCEEARDAAKETMDAVKQAVGLDYR